MSELNVGDLNVGSELNLPLYPESGLPSDPPLGHMVFNTTKGKISVWDGSNWISIGSSKYDIQPGGSNYTTTDLSGDYAGYRVIKFTGGGSFTINNAPDDQGIEFLLIGGGGGGGGVIGGGGGAGGVIYKRDVYLPAGVYNVSIGSGGIGGVGWNNSGQEGTAGVPSTITGGNIFYEALGGGGGSAHGGNSPGAGAGKGGSGGGSASADRKGGQATGVLCGNIDLHLKTDHAMNQPGSFKSEENNTVVGRSSHFNAPENGIYKNSAHDNPAPNLLKGWQGYPGGDFGGGDEGAGGGGAGQCGENAGQPGNQGGDGGHGIYCEIEGSKIAYAGGGGGGVRGTSRNRGLGGVGGGGHGGNNSVASINYPQTTSNAAQNGKDNTGGGGGGGGYNGSSTSVIGATGGSGVLIIRYKYT